MLTEVLTGQDRSDLVENLMYLGDSGWRRRFEIISKRDEEYMILVWLPLLRIQLGLFIVLTCFY
jgi:hypothetical protein